jgi:hypothetical protein
LRKREEAMKRRVKGWRGARARIIRRKKRRSIYSKL